MGKKIGATMQFLIEPKSREPTAHQYDYDAQTVMGFLNHYGLQNDFKINIEPNHTTLAGHDYEHCIRMSAAFNMLGSVDCNAGQQGGIAPGGNNFDAKLRRESTDLEDMFITHIGGMDCLARGLKGAAKLMQEGSQKAIVNQRYLTWDENPLAIKVKDGQCSLEELEEYAKKTACPWTKPTSSKHEQLEQLINRYI